MKWVSWNRTKVAHAVPVSTDHRVGSYPTACGVFTPDAFDVGTHFEAPSKRRCRRCVKAVG